MRTTVRLLRTSAPDMSSSRRNIWIAILSAGSLALGSCSGTSTERATSALQVSPGITVSSATYWIIAPNGTVTTGTVAVGNSATVPVIVSNLPAGIGYQLIVSGVANDGVTGCSGSATFNAPAPSSGVIVHLTCAGPPSPGQALVAATVNVCPMIDDVEADPSEANVGASMALQVTAHDPDSGPAALAYAWSSDGGSLSAAATADATFSCAQVGTFNITVAASDGDSTCSVLQTFAVTCTEP